MNTRQTAIGLLDKMDVPYTSKISQERAIIKLKRNMDAENLPKNLSDDEKELLGQLGMKFEKTPKKAKIEKETEKPENKDRYCSWIECATEAILESTDLRDAAVKTVKIFHAKNPNSNIKGRYGDLYVSYAQKVLVMVGKIQVEGTEIFHITNE